MDPGALQFGVFVLAFVWFALFSRQSVGCRVWMCCGSVLLMWMMVP